jgi:hypothetical protein
LELELPSSFPEISFAFRSAKPANDPGFPANKIIPDPFFPCTSLSAQLYENINMHQLLFYLIWYKILKPELHEMARQKTKQQR